MQVQEGSYFFHEATAGALCRGLGRAVIIKRTLMMTMLVMRRRRMSDHDAEMTITMPVTPGRPCLVTKAPSFLQTTKQRIPDTPAKKYLLGQDKTR